MLATEAAHADDRPDDSAFQRIIAMQKSITDMRANAENDLATKLKAALANLPKLPVK